MRPFAPLCGSALLLLGACTEPPGPSAPPPSAPPARPSPAAQPSRPAELVALDLTSFVPADDPVPAEPERPRDGAWELRWANGELAMTGTLRRGRRHGQFTYYRGGQVFESGAYEDGAPVGEWVTRHIDGSQRRVTLTRGYCTTESILQGPPRDATRMCGNGLMARRDDPRLDEDAAALRRCADDSSRWLRTQLESSDAGVRRLARQLVMRSASPEAQNIVRDVVADALRELDESDRESLTRAYEGLGLMAMLGDDRLRHEALAAFVEAEDDSNVAMNLHMPLSELARSRPAFAEHYLAATLRSDRLRPPNHIPTYLLEAARIAASHRRAEQRIELWRGVRDHMSDSREAAGSSPNNTDGRVGVELARACRDAGQHACAVEELERAIAIFDSMECTRCLEEARPELAALSPP